MATMVTKTFAFIHTLPVLLGKAYAGKKKKLSCVEVMPIYLPVT
jgi:hypothetical protein